MGGSGTDTCYGIAVDGDGNTYVAGETASTDFPLVNPYQPTNHGSNDVFISKLNAAGSALIYSTYLGGSGSDNAVSISIDASGNAYLTGATSSNNFPLMNAIRSFYG